MQNGRNLVGKQLPRLLGQQCWELLRQFARSLSNDSPLLHSFACGKREDKSLRHVAMVAKFLDDNKLKTTLEINKKRIRTVSNFDDLIQFHIICQITAKISAVKSERIVCKFRKRKRKFLCCVRVLCEAGA